MPPLIHPLPFRLIALDADGTLRGCTVAGRPPNRADEVVILPNVKETLAQYDWLGGHYRAGIISNQGGVALGYLTYQQCRRMLEDLLRAVTGVSWPRSAVRLCPHAPDAGCICRKPQPAMLEGLIEHYTRHGQLDHKGEVLYVGDQPSDWDTARAAGVTFLWAKHFFGWEEDTP